jgi:ABC-type protease/lipase transport system fused ATPase/permease subunit
MLSLVDRILMLAEGQAAAYGPRDEVLAALAKAQGQPPQPAAAPGPARPPSGLGPVRIGPAANPPRF